VIAPPPRPHPWAKFNPPPRQLRPLKSVRYAEVLPFARPIALPVRAAAAITASRALSGEVRPKVFLKLRTLPAPPTARTVMPAPVEPIVARVAPAVPTGVLDDVTRAPWGERAARPSVSDELARALTILAAESAVPVSATSAPFLTAAQRDLAAREARIAHRRRRVRQAGIGAAILAGVVLFVTQTMFRAPTEEALARHAQSIATAVLPLYSSPDQPLRLEGAEAVLRDAIDARHTRYAARVTLRVAKPLYEPGVSNGTVSYRQLQAALDEARSSDLKHDLIPKQSAAAIPTLPPLLQLTLRAGDSVVVTVPFTAERSVRLWRLSPPALAQRTVQPALRGAIAERYGSNSFLVVGAADSAAVIREKQRLARAYITAVAKEEQRRGIVRVAAPPPVAKAPPPRSDSSIVLTPLFNPDAVAVPESASVPRQVTAVDPDAPAVAAEVAGAARPPAVNPDAPAVDPDAPAVAPDAIRVPMRPKPAPR
jgi:hypothetical protein